MAYSKTQVLNGGFQDATGQPLSNGWLILALSHDSNVSLPASQVLAGVRTTITLDNNGNVAGTQSVWADDLLHPSGSYYRVEAYSNRGLKVWKAPQYWVLSSGAPIDLGSIVPSNP